MLTILKATTSSELDMVHDILLQPDVELLPESGTDIYSAFKFDKLNPITVPVTTLSLSESTLAAPFIINTIFKLHNGYTSTCLFSVVDKSNVVVLGITLTLVQMGVTRITLESDHLPNKQVSFTYHESLTLWTKLLVKVDFNMVVFYINCDQIYETEEGVAYIDFRKDMELFLGHSGNGNDFFEGVVQEIKIYVDGSESMKKQICLEVPILPASNESDYTEDGSEIAENLEIFTDFTVSPLNPAEKGQKGDKGDKGDIGEKGEQGSSRIGPQGPQGPPGIQGLQGTSGKKGEDGTMPEMRGSPGKSGPRGEVGNPGLPGFTGKQGEQGERGPSGIKGDRGDRGDDGAPGNDGIPGSKGEPGKDGNPGPQGPQGLMGPPGQPGAAYKETEKAKQIAVPGEKGDQGPMGPPGPQGPIAEKGETGNQGLKGDKGDRGHTGTEGPRGEKGDRGHSGQDGIPGKPGAHGKSAEKGEKGDRGNDGIPGNPGKSANLSSLLDPELDENTKAELVVMLRGIKGNVGRPGEKGDSGDIGPIGVAGAPGKDGRDVKGEKGEPGQPGLPGSVSPSHIALLKGQKGELGITGKQGAQGHRGHTGNRGSVGPPGKSGPRGPSGPRGETGTKGDKGERGESAQAVDIEKLKGQKGDQGTPGIRGEPGPPGQASHLLASPGQPGPPGPPGPSGPPGPPGLPSTEANKRESIGVFTHNTFYSFTEPDKTDNDGVAYTTTTVVYRTTTALIKGTSSTPVGTVAFVMQDEILMLRVRSGWKNIMLSDSSTTTTTEHPIPSRLMSSTPPPKRNPNGLFIRLAALNEPLSGKMLSYSSIGGVVANLECHKQSQNFKGNFEAFLATKNQDLRNLVREKDRHLPIKNLFGEKLFDSWSDMFNGSGAKFRGNIFSFNRKNALIDPTWPHKAVWHGADSTGFLSPVGYCDDWQNDSPGYFGFASPTRDFKLLGQEKYACDKKLIVLCIETSLPRHTKSRRLAQLSMRKNGKSRL